ncbi:Eco57I restriction-modification methylase domain-containing protein [Curtobacterium sp. MCBD17_023]|uniref:Eco57I restriction-modification methylase domain-containing protein n=1 Tax=Curtobacterium sp. MCBD17_023 TaxID=2175657 RepID=UPI000DA097EB|nr:DNA methyltransferase [Curtobacterium sp. MCBD17_023]PYY45743.1 class I SAM-dependent DNA methyltransferase [Curtobacterium sp. MCBD17_023]
MGTLTSEAIVVGEDWISEHYLTTDAKSQSFQSRVLERRAAWDAEDAAGGPSTRARFTAKRAELMGLLAVVNPESVDDGADGREALHALSTQLRSVLGYVQGVFHLDETGPVRYVAIHGLEDAAPLALIDAKPVAQLEDLLAKDGDTLLSSWTPNDDDPKPLTSVVRALSVVFEGTAKFALVLAGRWLLVAERDRWYEGRYLALDLQLVCERNDAKRGGEIDRVLTCVEAASLAPDGDGDVWWTVTLEDAVKHTVGVSEDLREGVRESIEIIANDVVERRRERGLEPLPKDQAQPLAKQSLRFLYRILFLLYAEASPQLGVLPVNAPEYENGYSLDRLRELALVVIESPQGERATHLYQSLDVLFRLVDRGHAPEARDDDGAEPGLQFESLRADLFKPEAIALIGEVGLSDRNLQQVLRRLLLSKETKGRDRGYISYADLGINQLGAVYEGLMSYTGFFAEEDLFEVAPNGDPSKGSWVVPVGRESGIESHDFVMREDPDTGQPKRVRHPAGSFVYRLAGRERQQSASYYTPEVLTQFTVSQALEELLDQDGQRTSAEEILSLTVCEPALGSGAFAIEAVRQLAEQYLKRREEELGERVDPDDRPRQLQKIKAAIALHQVYGVDLNATAVEFAEITLWLDTMSEGLEAPWFGLHLRRGNSLIGARRAVYDRSSISSKAWLKQVPRDVPLLNETELGEGQLRASTAGTVHHFLLPAEGWGSAVDAKEAKELAPEALAALKTWRRGILAKPTSKQIDQLIALAYRVETLWNLARRRLTIAEQEIRRDIPLWGRDRPNSERKPVVLREEIERTLDDPDGAYQRLRLVMDAWCAMWFWPLTNTLTDGAAPPTIDEWIATLRELLGEQTVAKTTAMSHGQVTLGSAQSGWQALNDEERDDLDFASASEVTGVLREHPWLAATQRVAEQQGFFHWELDFASVFERGGFDLQVGNPPWVRPDWDEDAMLAEADAWWALIPKPPTAEAERRKSEALNDASFKAEFLDSLTAVVATRSAVSACTEYPLLDGLRPDLYRCFMARTWDHSSRSGTIGLIHPESHFTDEKAGPLRAATYPRLRRHWQFVNELRLFEIHNLVTYGTHVYSSVGEVNFSQATNLYHPQTVIGSLRHTGEGEEPGLKDREGNWDLRPHKSRIVTVTEETLATWHAVLEDESVPVRRSRMVYAVNHSTAAVLDKLSKIIRIGDLKLEYSAGWNETTDFKRGFFRKAWGPVATWDDAILQGPHIFVGNPFYKRPNESMSSNKDWSPVDLETLTPDAIPITTYKPAGNRAAYDAAYTQWGVEKRPARDFYRVVWRTMAANTGERTLIPTVMPPGATHVDGLFSAGTPAGDPARLLTVAGTMMSLLADFCIRVAPKSTIRAGTVARLPFVSNPVLASAINLRVGRLVCQTRAFRDLWACAFETHRVESDSDINLGEMAQQTEGPSAEWDPSVPLRRALDRRQALVEIDAIVALAFGTTADELCSVYRTQFAVLYGYDRNVYFYDANGRLVPIEVLKVWRQKQDAISGEERTATNASGNTYTYELPFRTLDREADMRQAYAHFEKLLKDEA